MRCPNCEQELGSKAVCPACGVDAVLFAKVCAASDALYNRALTKVRLKDLSGAVECLNKSIAFNRNHTNARNLLGLVYYEMGEFGEALRHWVISTKDAAGDNLAVGYIDRIQARTRELERFNDAIKMYNQALIYVQQKSEDLAIIQLRKAVDINPKFISALNLLAFCYLIHKDKEHARAVVERVLAQDVNNAIALNYLMEMGAPRQRADAAQKTASVRQGAMTQATGGYKRLTTNDRKSFGSNFHITEILFFALGAICAMALFYMLILPSEVDQHIATVERLKTENQAAAEDLTSTREAFEDERAVWQEEKANLEKQNAQMGETLVLHEKIQQAYSIIIMHSSEMVEEAAEAVYSFDTSGLPADVLERLLAVKEAAFKQTAQSNYAQGAQDYNAARYADAKIKLGKALKFADPEATFTPDVMYLLGLIAERDDEAVEAVKYYQMIVSNYPNSNRYNRAIEGIRRLSD